MTEKLINDRLLMALRRRPVDVTPVWIMRQAGRYLPEYRATRQRAGDFMTLCKTPELACEVTLQPLQRFDLDAAILFSDILTIPDAMGLGLSVVENKGPQFARPLRSGKDIRNLAVPDVETDLGYVLDAVRLIKRELRGKAPLVGFAGSPWTIATYMIEGGSSKNFSRAKGMLYAQPDLMHLLLDVLSRSVTDYLNAQVAAGVDAAMIFDSWGGILSHAAYREFSLEYMRRIVRGIREADRGVAVPVILFTRGGGPWMEDIAESGCDAIGLDWTTDIGSARRRVGDKVALQGNLDTAVLYSSPESIRRHVAEILSAFGDIGGGDAGGHVFNLGHGIHPDVDPGKVTVLVDAVHELSRPFHKRREEGIVGSE